MRIEIEVYTHLSEYTLVQREEEEEMRISYSDIQRTSLCDFRWS